MNIDLDRAMAVLKVREETIPWDVTIAVAGKDYPVQRPTSEQRAALEKIRPETSIVSLRALVRGMLKFPEEVGMEDELLAGVAMTILLSLSDFNKRRQQILAEEIRIQIAADEKQE